MKIKRQIYLVASAIIALSVCVSCAKEDPIESLNDGFANYFAPLAGATDPESVLRREFYDLNKCYLLFNDTLVSRQVGVDKDGMPLYFHETVDLSYDITSSTTTKYVFTYFANLDSKERAAKMIQDELLSKMSESQRPFSILLTDMITAHELHEGRWIESDRDFVKSTRCTAIAIKDITDKTDEELTELGKAVLNKFINSSLKSNMGKAILNPFFVFGEGQYDMYYDMEEDWGEYPEIEDVRELGFISGTIDNEEYYYIQFPSKERDLQDFANAVLTMTYEAFEAEHADYPFVLEKYNILKQVIKDLGYNIN